MQKEVFDKLMNSILNHCGETVAKLHDIKTTEDLKKKSLEEVIQIVAFCQKEVDIMTTIAMTDLYHIIGMGNLSSVQLNKFIRVFKEYISYRPIMKDLATKVDSISDLPQDLDATRIYSLEGLDHSIVFKNNGTEKLVEDKDSIGKINPSCYTKSTLPFTFTPSQGKIIFEARNVTAVYAALKDMGIVNNAVDPAIFETKVKNKSSYCGITWSALEGDRVCGVLNSSTHLCRLRKTYAILPD